MSNLLCSHTANSIIWTWVFDLFPPLPGPSNAKSRNLCRHSEPRHNRSTNTDRTFPHLYFSFPCEEW
ncbi:unnamed protein product [Mycena citricolor]|uniref:Uncharacterized protein n=1 Tax=Mycena citricolor TaxID=2018698 RepID=A0AAD2HPS3_9AGAR|nr:unnamed protein product [Mycena citricolor]